MKLEDKFFKDFFYPFLSGVILSSLTIIIFLGSFINKNYNNETSQDLINFRKNYSKVIINSAISLLTSKFLKFQVSLNELAVFYQKVANEVLNSNKQHIFNNAFLKCVIDFPDDFCSHPQEGTEHWAMWMVDRNYTEKNLDDKIDVKQQLIAFSGIIQNLDAILELFKPATQFLFFYFDATDLYVTFPVKYECFNNWIGSMKYHDYKNTICIDENGNYYTTYKVGCEAFYTTIMKSKSKSFDYNYLSNQYRSIYINNYFGVSDYDSSDVKVNRTFDICVEFDDPISKGKGYACTNAPYEDLISSFDELNSKIDGYYFISNVGYNNVFYFPQGTISPKTSTENIYKWGIKYILDEKKYFHEHVRKIMSSNYIDNIGDSIQDEVFVNGKNSSDQFFYINKEKLKYSIYPVILENLKGQKEHVMSLIYIYKEQLFFDKINSHAYPIEYTIILVIIIFMIFGSILLYIIFLTLSLLAKYIVIPIKNVIYMLKGINIGGKYRLKYLDFLKRKQDENLEKLEKMYLYDNKNIKSIEKTESELEDNYDEEYNDNDNLTIKISTKTKDSTNELVNKYSDFNTIFEEESNHIEKEYSFYDFDEQLLQYRPLEIEHLLTSLMDLKTAILLTSKDRDVRQIIDYSNSDKIFRNYKINEGAIICQSNIGNMESQLYKYDKAIYHLALSLQDNNLKKFLDQNINDEFDENDSLLNKISNFYNSDKKSEKNNRLVEKQINNSKKNFSQKLIGILINTRYCRLIHSYYMFFKNMQKLQKSNEEIKSKLFMNTLFHTINYYHKIIIQFIFLSYIKNDSVKIGESILNYLEFLIKFKFKTSSEQKYILKLKERNRPEFRIKQQFKKKIFDKIISWFNLFDDYISYVKNNSSLADSKSIIEDYSRNFNNDHFEFNLESQTSFMFQINIQKSNYLKGKFSLYCKNYNDALYYFICASKKESLVIDGLIKKRSLKHIYKILVKLNKIYDKLGIRNLNMEKHLKEFQNKTRTYGKKLKLGHKRTNNQGKNEYIKMTTFGEEIETIRKDIVYDINECNAKKEKDIIILIDFNIYNKKEKNIYIKSNIIDSFVEETKVILNDYLSTNDRLSVFIYENDYKIICPLVSVNKIDNENFLKDLSCYKNNIFNHDFKTEEYIEENDFEFNLGGNNNISEHSQEDSFEISDKEEKIIDKIKGLVKAINYVIYYSRMKGSKNDKYILIFTDLLNKRLIEEDSQIAKIMEKLKNDKEAILILVGKTNNSDFKTRKKNFFDEEQIFEDFILNKFGEKSEIIYFENMKKIKTILSNNKVIKDDIFYPNEIYK